MAVNSVSLLACAEPRAFAFKDKPCILEQPWERVRLK